MRPRLPPDSLTGIGSRGKYMGAQEADCNAERMASALESRALKIQRKSSLAVAPSQRKFALRGHNHLLRRQHCSSLCSQSEGHEHVANMTNALGDDFVVFSTRAWPPQYSPPSLCEQSELQCFAPGLRRTLLFSKNAGSFDNFVHPTLQRRCRLSTNLGGFWIFGHPTSKVKFRPAKVRPQPSEKPYVA